MPKVVSPTARDAQKVTRLFGSFKNPVIVDWISSERHARYFIVYGIREGVPPAVAS
jgi:hypothetical protein